MALIEDTLFGRVDKVQMAIERIKMFEPPEGYYLAFSGGKDSQCIYHLAEMAGVKFDAHYNLTTVDPPELVHFIKKNYPEVKIHRPQMTMWQLIKKKKMLPTRISRYCCDYLKEGKGNTSGEGRTVMMGIRWEESIRRKDRKMVQQCLKQSKVNFCPILDWTIDDVWEFIKGNNIPYCDLYNEGFKRLGCVMCPFGNQEKESKRWPKISNAYYRAGERARIERIKFKGNEFKSQFKNFDEEWNWWIKGEPIDNPDQTVMFE